MIVTQAGLDLIKHHEGFRAKAYRDAVGVWTIGYGHTSMAGPPPVAAGMTISREEANAMLARDVEMFARGVESHVHVPLNDTQFSALVSFAYNVGLGNFSRSSVLTAVNAGDFAAVPRRLNVWNKAGGRVLPGLVRRRAEEGALFASLLEHDATSPPQPPAGKPLLRSRTVWGACAALALSALQLLGQHQITLWMLLCLTGVAVAAALIIHERKRRSKEEGL